MITLREEQYRQQQARWKPIYVAEFILLIIGIICIGWVGWNYGTMALDQSWSEYELNAQLRGESPSLWGYIFDRNKPAPPPVQEQPQERAEPKPAPPVQLRQGATVGRIEIPRLKIEAVVKYGSDDRTLKRAVGLVPGTALPGRAGNVGIAAHRDTFFRNLSGVKIGDVIRMTTPTGSFDYQVESTDIVRPKNVEVLAPTSDPAMTLVTCYPFNYVGHAPKRFIVRAKQITPETPEQVQAKAARPARLKRS